MPRTRYRYYLEDRCYLSEPVTLDEAIDALRGHTLDGPVPGWLVEEDSDGKTGRIAKWVWGGVGTLAEPAWMDIGRTTTLAALGAKDLLERLGNAMAWHGHPEG